MTRAADLIAALSSRRPAPVLERQTGLPHGWGLWLRDLPGKLGRIGREKSQALVGHFVSNPPRPQPGPPGMGRWRAFRSLFYQHWGPPPREERGLRWFAGIVSFLLHLLFVLFLAIFAIVGVDKLPPDDSSNARTQVRFVGRGAPQQQGGGAPAEAAQEKSAASEAPATPAAAAATAHAQPAAAPLAASQPAEAQPSPSPPVAAEQPVQVSEPTPTIADYVLPPPTVRPAETRLPAPRAPELRVPEREVTVVETPVLQPTAKPRDVAAPELPQVVQQVREREVEAPLELPQVQTAQVAPKIAAPTLPQTTATVREREIPAPVELPQVQATQVASKIEAPALRQPAAEVREREIPAPSAQAAAASAAAATQASSAQAPAPTPAAAPANGGTRSAAKTAGPGIASQSGGFPSPQKGDDWDTAKRNAPGAQKPGLFDADGSVRVGDDLAGKTTTQPGAPGSRAQQAYDADRASKWTQRTQYPYEPTMFDKYWVPRESLLAEWVRKGIKEVEMSIPGTSKKVRCVVSLLQVGGACGLFDPNLNDQPATARPPPEIPQKRNPIPTGS